MVIEILTFISDGHEFGRAEARQRDEVRQFAAQLHLGPDRVATLAVRFGAFVFVRHLAVVAAMILRKPFALDASTDFNKTVAMSNLTN